MLTPYQAARAVAAAIAESFDVLSDAEHVFGASHSVYLGGPGTAYERLPLPFVVVSFASMEDGETTADSFVLTLAIGVAANTGMIGVFADPGGIDTTKPRPIEGDSNLFEVGRGEDLLSFAQTVADVAVDALTDCVVEKRDWRFRIGVSPVETAVVSLSVKPGIGWYAPEESAIRRGFE